MIELKEEFDSPASFIADFKKNRAIDKARREVRKLERKLEQRFLKRWGDIIDEQKKKQGKDFPILSILQRLKDKLEDELDEEDRMNEVKSKQVLS